MQKQAAGALGCMYAVELGGHLKSLEGHESVVSEIMFLLVVCVELGPFVQGLHGLNC